MSYRIAAIDIHKSVLMVVVATAAEEVADATGEALRFETRRFGTGHAERMHRIAWLQERGVTEVVMESTAQYWKPVWLDLEPHFARLHLAQAHSNRAPKGRKDDYRDAKRLARRLLAGELMLSFIPGPEQRLWRILMRTKAPLVRGRVRLQNEVEALLEDMRSKLSAVISDLFGASGRRILQALAKGETDPARLAELGDKRLQCGRAALADALEGAPTPTHLFVLQQHLHRLDVIDEQIGDLDQEMARQLRPHQDVVARVAGIPGLGVDSAQQIIAEVGVDAEAFPSAGQFVSWAGLCPGANVSAEQNHSSRCAKGNPFVRRLLTQAAQAAANKKGCHFQAVFRRLLPRLGYPAAIWAIAHRLGRLLWKVLHDQVHYIEQAEDTTPAARKRRAQKYLKALRQLGYTVIATPQTPALATPPA